MVITTGKGCIGPPGLVSLNTIHWDSFFVLVLSAAVLVLERLLVIRTTLPPHRQSTRLPTNFPIQTHTRQYPWNRRKIEIHQANFISLHWIDLTMRLHLSWIFAALLLSIACVPEQPKMVPRPFEAEPVAKIPVGELAPDIVGKDLDGNEFKLSDYRGQVVMLDFWGDW